MPNFCIGFRNDIGNKKLEKNHFPILPISHENNLGRPVFEGFDLDRKSSPPFETNRIDNYGCFQVMAFDIFTKSAKIK